MKGIEELKQNGNLLEKLLNPQEKIYLLRVYGYESHVGNVYYRGNEDYMKSDTEEEKKLLKVFQQIRKKIDEEKWNDNKIVAEIIVGSWRVFVGYWDWTLSIGGSVVPNLHSPKFKSTEFGYIEKISVR